MTKKSLLVTALLTVLAAHIIPAIFVGFFLFGFPMEDVPLLGKVLGIGTAIVAGYVVDMYAFFAGAIVLLLIVGIQKLLND